MGTREATSKESRAAQRWCIIFLLFGYVHLVTSQCSDDEATAAPPCPPSPPQLPYSSMNFCPDHLITKIPDGLTCTPPSVAPPPAPALPHDGGDLNSVTSVINDQEMSAVTFVEAVVRKLLDSRKDEGTTQWEILFILIFSAAVCALLFCENNPMRIIFAQEELLMIFVVNALMAFLLPAEWLWVPVVCFASSLLTLIIAPWLP